MVAEERDVLKEIQCEMETGNKEEVVIKAIKELMKSSTKSVKSAEWLSENGILYHQGKIYVPDSDLCRHISALCHDSKIAGHLGRWKTLELVSRNYQWPQMSRYISKYVSTCDTCLHTKVSRQPPVGELNPLSVADAPWDTISVDFIVELPESEGKDAIMVVVDSVTKDGHFVDMITTLSAAGTARLYVQHIWKHHGLPKKAVSDREPQFVVEFMRNFIDFWALNLQ